MKKRLVVKLIIAMLSLATILCFAIGCGGAHQHVYGKGISNNDGTHTKTCLYDANHTVTEICTFVDYTCSNCGYSYYTEGLDFVLSGNGMEYFVSGCSPLLKNVIIPSTYQGKPVTSIGEGAFENCTSLTNVVIGNSVKSIGDYAFEDCSSLTNIVIGNSVTSIGMDAFSECSSLTSIEIPNSVKSISDGAFSYCSSLTSIKFNGTKAEWNAITKTTLWLSNTKATFVICTDGVVAI